MNRIMAHMVPFYPDLERSLAVAEGIVEGGASYLEVQFPFSDPTADGPAIQAACQAALHAGFTVDQGFAFIRQITARTDVPVFIMTYASIIYAKGVDRFITAGTDAGAAGFILPDLPFDHDEGAYAAAARHKTAIMPVIVTTMPEGRLQILTERRPEFIYVALRSGITGSRTELGDENLGFLDRLRPLGARVMAGFGISERAQVRVLAPHVHAAIVGTVLVRTVATHAEASPAVIREALRERVASLLVDE